MHVKTPGYLIVKTLLILQRIVYREFDTLANDVEFGLAASISARSLASAMGFGRRMDAGVPHMYNPTAGLELQMSFGGCKNSTSGYREMGSAAIDFYSLMKTLYLDA